MSCMYRDGTPGRGGITGQQHALRCGALGETYGISEESGIIGLVHDLARPLNDVHHGEIIAEIMRDRVSEEAYQVLRTHGMFQASIVHKDKSLQPNLPEHAFSVAGQLAGFELRSFRENYDGPVLTITEARGLLRKYLG